MYENDGLGAIAYEAYVQVAATKDRDFPPWEDLGPKTREAWCAAAGAAADAWVRACSV